MMEGQIQMIFVAAGIVVIAGLILTFLIYRRRTAYLGSVKEELQKEKAWLRRGEYNAAMVKGRQNLELLLKLVAEKNGIQLDNTAQAVANAKEQGGRQNQYGRQEQGGCRNGDRRHGNKTTKVMTHHQFNRWLNENGYLDRVSRWEMNQVRQIGNKAVHENYAEKEDAWNQYNYLEDILKTITEMSQSKAKRQERIREAAEERRKNGQGQKKRRKSVKSVKKGQTAAAEKGQGAVEQKKQPAAEDGAKKEEQTGKRRRRRRKPKSAQKVQTVEKETAAVVEKKAAPAAAEKKAVPAAAEKKAAPAESKSGDQPKKRRNHRRRKPSGAAKSQPAAEKPSEAAKSQPAAEKPAAAETGESTAKPKKKSGNYRRKRRNHKKTSGQPKETCPGGQE